MTPYYDNGVCQLYHADARELPLADQSVHCVVTSPPYFGLRIYQGIVEGGIGLESTVEDYIANLVDVFREVRRVLRDDGVLWINLGDSYEQNTGAGFNGNKRLDDANRDTATGSEFGPGNRLGIPERVVLALQADGWIWRDTVIWAKKSAMPESVNGWRWERCQVKVAAGTVSRMGDPSVSGFRGFVASSDHPGLGHLAKWSDCPGCPKCAANDGLVLRKGSWRCTSSHEYIVMLVKGMGYYADAEAVRIPHVAGHLQRHLTPTNRPGTDGTRHGGERGAIGHDYLNPGGANRRSVWNDISPEPYGGSHYATFPSDLPRICIQASTSEQGCCPGCGAQWARVVDMTAAYRELLGQEGAWNSEAGKPDSQTKRQEKAHPAQVPEKYQTLGWRPTCDCTNKRGDLPRPPVPSTILDPFAGTFTTGLAAQRLGRRAMGVDLSEDYLKQAVNRLERVTLPLTL